jgi:hypothetical protein
MATVVVEVFGLYGNCGGVEGALARHSDERKGGEQWRPEETGDNCSSSTMS